MQGRASAMPGARAALRRATSEVHERLHISPGFLEIAEGRLTLAGYRVMLSRLAGLYFGLAPELEIDPARLELLALDLADLDAPPPLPIACQVPSGEARRLGWKYVVEGSIFGGQVIYRQLDYLFGDASAGRRFFAGSPAALVRWRALCEDFERIGQENAELEEMVAGSQEAFALFEREFAAEAVHG